MMTAKSRHGVVPPEDPAAPDAKADSDVIPAVNAGNDEGHTPLESTLVQSRALYQARNWTQLNELVSAGLQRHPDNYELVLLKARAVTNLRNWEEAVVAWTAVCNVRPSWAEAWYQKARALVRKGDRLSAKNAAEVLRTQSRIDTGALVFFIRIAFEIEDLKGAAAALAELTQSDRATAEREAANFEREGDIRALVIAVKAIHDMGPGKAAEDERLQDLSEQLLRRAISRERGEMLADAYLDCAVLLDIYPDDTLAQKSLARVLRSLQVKSERLLKEELFEEAADAYRELARCTPHDPNVLINYGRVLMRLKRPAAALPIWERLVEHFPDRREGYIQLARSLDRSSQFGRATKAWRKVLALDPENVEAQQALSAITRRAITAGRTAITEGRFVEAWRIFNDLQAEEPGNDEPPRRLDQIERNILKEMRAAYKQRRLQQIFAYGQEIPNLLHDNAEAQLLLARAAMELHRFDVAAQGWRNLATLDPLNSSKPHLQIARCYLRAGLPMEAGAAIKELRAREPNNPEAQKLKDDLREMMLASGLERR